MEANAQGGAQANRALLWTAFAALYIAWGSTYLAIRFAIETLPPLLMAGVRFLIAGGLLYAGARIAGTPAPAWKSWKPAAIIGAMLLLLGNGGVVWAEKTVPSGVTALLIGATPFCMVLINWLAFRGVRPRTQTVIGLLVGFAGLYALIGPLNSSHSESIDPFGATLIFIATLSWTIGSLYSKHAQLPQSPILSSAMQMLAGGVMLFAAGLARGEVAGFHFADVSMKSLGALAYLIFVGSLIGFSAYVYVLKHANAATASTYAYVNPVVAVVLGWAFAGEPIGIRTLLAGASIVAAVILITTDGGSSGKPVPAATTDDLPDDTELVA